MMNAITTLCPSYQRFIQEQKSANGDPSLAARTFLYKVIPFVMECVVTSGIYFVTDFPNSPFTSLLRVSLFVLSYFYFIVIFYDRIGTNSNFVSLLLGLIILPVITVNMFFKLLLIVSTIILILLMPMLHK